MFSDKIYQTQILSDKRLGKLFAKSEENISRNQPNWHAACLRVSQYQSGCPLAKEILMLVLTRKTQEKIQIGDDITVIHQAGICQRLPDFLR